MILTCSLLWVRCLFDPLQDWSFGGQMTLMESFLKFLSKICISPTIHVSWPNLAKNRPMGSCRKVVWYCSQKWKQYRLSAYNNFCYISPICPEVPSGRIRTKFGTGGSFADVIDYTNFFVYRFLGFDFVGTELFLPPEELKVAINIVWTTIQTVIMVITSWPLTSDEIEDRSNW